MNRVDKDEIDLAEPTLPRSQGREDPDSDLERSLQKKEVNAFHYVKISAIYLIAGLAGLYLVLFFLNLFLPESHRWLSHQELLDLRGIAISILSGVITSLAINYLSKRNLTNDGTL